LIEKAAKITREINRSNKQSLVLANHEATTLQSVKNFWPKHKRQIQQHHQRQQFRFQDPRMISERAGQNWEKNSASIPQKAMLHTNITSSISNTLGDWFFLEDAPLPENPEDSLPSKFFYALTLAGEMEGKDVPDHDIPRALELLLEVAKKDPDNSAPLLYMSIIEKKQGNNARAAELLNLARTKTTKFSTYESDFLLPLYRNVKTPAELMDAISAYSRTPIAKVAGLKDLLIKENDEVIAKQMMAPALSNERLHMIQWRPLDYMIGYVILQKQNKSANLMHPRDLFAKRRLKDFQVGELDELEKRCNVQELEAWVREYQKL
jgi:hypothetical protein